MSKSELDAAVGITVGAMLGACCWAAIFLFWSYC